MDSASMNCYLCLSEGAADPQMAHAQCSECGRFACYDHTVRAERGSFLCLACYSANEARYRKYRRPVEKPRYRIPREPK